MNMPGKNQLTSDQMSMIRLFGVLLKGSQTIFGLKDCRHRYLYVNNELANLFGRPADNIVGFKPDDFILHADAKAVYQHQDKVMSTGRAARYISHISINSRIFTFAIVYFPLKNDLGLVTGVGFIGVHIQDQTWINAGMQDMLEKAQETILELKKQMDGMRLQMTTDPLTGVWNRVQAEAMGRREMTRQDRKNTPVTLVFAAPDYFKNIIGACGHVIGDMVLVEFCHVIGSCLRTSDVLARWGREEFIIILPDTGLECAEVISERIRVAVETYPFTHINSLTSSFGIAACMPGEAWRHWVERTDAALYRARIKGCNRVELDRSGFSDGIPAGITQPSGFLRLAWLKSHECGHPVLDHQHRQLFVQANHILSALLAGKSRENIRSPIENLTTAIVGHIRDEEKIMRDAGFPGLKEHAAIHSHLIRKIRQLAKHYYNGKLELGKFFSVLAYDVIYMHLQVDDKKYFPYMKNNADSLKNNAGSLKNNAGSLVFPTSKAGEPDASAGSGTARPPKNKTSSRRKSNSGATLFKTAKSSGKRIKKAPDA